MQLSRIAWLVTVGVCLVAALILLLSGYDGYAGVSLAVAGADAINLFCIPAAVGAELLARPHAVRGLEVDQHVGAVQALLDRVLQGMRGVVGLLERGPA